MATGDAPAGIIRFNQIGTVAETVSKEITSPVIDDPLNAAGSILKYGIEYVALLTAQVALVLPTIPLAKRLEVTVNIVEDVKVNVHEASTVALLVQVTFDKSNIPPTELLVKLAGAATTSPMARTFITRVALAI